MVIAGEAAMSDETTTPLETPAISPGLSEAAPASEPHAAQLPDTAEHVAASQLPDTDEYQSLDPVTEDLAAAEVSNTTPEAPVEQAAEAEPPAEPAKPARKKRAKKSEAEEESATTEAAKPDGPSGRNWYVIKVQSGREESIKGAIERKIKIEGLEPFFGRIEIPVEEVVEKRKVKAKVKDKKTGEVDTVYQEKNVTKKRKKYPGYLFAEVEFNNDILSVFRETSGVGDFVGASIHRAPAPMPEHEVQSMLTGVAVKGKAPAGKVKVKLDYEKGDKVKIRDGAFSGMEGEVKHISEAKDATETPKVKVEVTIFGRPVEVELDYWQVDKA